VHNRSLNVIRDRKKFSDGELPDVPGNLDVAGQLEAMELEEKMKADPGFLDGIDMMILDMMLEETHQRHRDDKAGSHTGVAMTGSQMGATLILAYPQLQSVPFIIYSSKDPEEIQAHLDELFEFTEFDENVNKNYRGFVPKRSDSGSELLEKAVQILSL